MSVQDPADGAVTLDRAEEAGLMAYPDILGKWVSTHRAISPQTTDTAGECVQVGPLGLSPDGTRCSKPTWVPRCRQCPNKGPLTERPGSGQRSRLIAQTVTVVEAPAHTPLMCAHGRPDGYMCPHCAGGRT